MLALYLCTVIEFSSTGVYSMSILFLSTASLTVYVSTLNQVVAGYHIGLGVLISGLLFPNEDVNPFYRVLSWFHPMTWIARGVLTNEFNDKQLSCQNCAISSGNETLDYLFDEHRYIWVWYSLLIQLGLCLFYGLVFYIVTKYYRVYPSYGVLSYAK